jgi:hypothetical protein
MAKSGSIRQKRPGSGKPKRKTSRRRTRKLPPMETYSDERIAEFLLNNSVGAEDYARAREEVRTLGLDPDAIDHDRPVEIQ